MIVNKYRSFLGLRLQNNSGIFFIFFSALILPRTNVSECVFLFIFVLFRFCFPPALLLITAFSFFLVILVKPSLTGNGKSS